MHSTPAATASATPTTTLYPRMVPPTDRPHRTRPGIRHGAPAGKTPGQWTDLRERGHRVGGELLVGEVEVDRGVLTQLREPVVAVDHADGAGLGPHHDR